MSTFNPEYPIAWCDVCQEDTPHYPKRLWSCVMCRRRYAKEYSPAHPKTNTTTSKSDRDPTPPSGQREIRWHESCGQYTERYNNGRCVPCSQEKSREWKAANPERTQELQEKWERENPGRRAALNKIWRESHPEETKARNAANYARNREQNIASALARAAADPEKHRESSRKDKRRRRALRLENGYESYRDNEVFKYHNWICHLCDVAIDPTLPRNTRFGAQIDHIIPLARGGPDCFDNVAPAHGTCNTRRQDKSVEEFREILRKEAEPSDAI